MYENLTKGEAILKGCDVMKKEREKELSPTPLNPVFGIEMNLDGFQNEPNDGSADINEKE